MVLTVFAAVVGAGIIGILMLASHVASIVLAAYFQLQQTVLLSNDLVKEARLGLDASRAPNAVTYRPPNPDLSREVLRLNAENEDLKKENIVVTNWCKGQAMQHNEYIRQLQSSLYSSNAANSDFRGRIEKLEEDRNAASVRDKTERVQPIDPEGVELRARIEKLEKDSPSKLDVDQANVEIIEKLLRPTIIPLNTNVNKAIDALREELQEARNAMQRTDLQRVQADEATDRERLARETAETTARRLERRLRARHRHREQEEERLVVLRAEMDEKVSVLTDGSTRLRSALNVQQHRADMAELCAGLSSFTMTIPIPNTSTTYDTVPAPEVVGAPNKAISLASDTPQKPSTGLLATLETFELESAVISNIRDGIKSCQKQLRESNQSVKDVTERLDIRMADVNSNIESLKNQMTTYGHELLESRDEITKTRHADLDQCKEKFAAAQRVVEDQEIRIMTHVRDKDTEHANAFEGLQARCNNIPSLVDQITEIRTTVDALAQPLKFVQVALKLERDSRMLQEAAFAKLQTGITADAQKLEELKRAVMSELDDHKATNSLKIEGTIAEMQKSSDQILLTQKGILDFAEKVNVDSSQNFTTSQEAVANLRWRCRRKFRVAEARYRAFFRVVENDLRSLRHDRDDLLAQHRQLSQTVESILNKSAPSVVAGGRTAATARAHAAPGGDNDTNMGLGAPISNGHRDSHLREGTSHSGFPFVFAHNTQAFTKPLSRFYPAPDGKSAAHKTPTTGSFSPAIDVYFPPYTLRPGEKIDFGFGSAGTSSDSSGTPARGAPIFSFDSNIPLKTPTNLTEQAVKEPITVSKVPTPPQERIKQPQNEAETSKQEDINAQPLTHYSSQYLKALRDHMGTYAVLTSLYAEAHGDDNWIDELINSERELKDHELRNLSVTTRCKLPPYSEHILEDMFRDIFEVRVYKIIMANPEDHQILPEKQVLQENYMKLLKYYMDRHPADSLSGPLLARKTSSARDDEDDKKDKDDESEEDGTDDERGESGRESVRGQSSNEEDWSEEE